jgi:hypothetical protein
LVALLVASLITGILVYRARTPNLALEVPRIDRLLGTGGDADLPVELVFFVRFDEPHALVELVGGGNETVRTFAADVPLAAEERIRCVWNGVDDEGERVGPGNYRLRVVLPEQDRDMVFPQRIAVRRPPPEPQADPNAPCEFEATGEPLEG